MDPKAEQVYGLQLEESITQLQASLEHRYHESLQVLWKKEQSREKNCHTSWQWCSRYRVQTCLISHCHC